MAPLIYVIGMTQQILCTWSNNLFTFVDGRSSRLQNMQLKIRFELLWCAHPKRMSCNSYIAWSHRSLWPTLKRPLEVGCPNNTIVHPNLVMITTQFLLDWGKPERAVHKWYRHKHNLWMHGGGMTVTWNNYMHTWLYRDIVKYFIVHSHAPGHTI